MAARKGDKTEMVQTKKVYRALALLQPYRIRHLGWVQNK